MHIYSRKNGVFMELLTYDKLDSILFMDYDLFIFDSKT